METMIASVFGVFLVFFGVLFAFFKGKSTGKDQSKAQKNEEKLDELEQVEFTRENVKESDNAANSKDRDDLIADLIADSVRGPEGRDRQ